MTGQEARAEMKQMLGRVPEFMSDMPEELLGAEWELFRKVQMDEGKVPHKYRELIGLGIAAVTKCKYCIYFHTEMAKLMGATEAEIREAMHYAKNSVGWSAYVSGRSTDFDQFRKDVDGACAHVRKGMGAAAAGDSAPGGGRGERERAEWAGRSGKETPARAKARR